MEDLKVIILSNNEHNCNKLVKMLSELSLTNIEIKNESSNLIKRLRKNDLDFIFIDVEFLGPQKTIELAQEIELYQGTPYLIISSRKCYLKNREKIEKVKFEIGNYITFDIMKFDLLCEIINELNSFNHNYKIKKIRDYSFLYLVTDEIEILKVDIDSIIEIIKDNGSVYINAETGSSHSRTFKIINMNYPALFKVLSKNFIKINDNKIINRIKESEITELN